MPALEAGRIRLRPILMTSVATVMGALPIALGLGAGSLSRRPLGYAIVGRAGVLHLAHAVRGARGLRDLRRHRWRGRRRRRPVHRGSLAPAEAE